MKRKILFVGLMLCAMATGAEARSWGFDRDTVQSESSTVAWLTNTGTDTLKLDSVFAENALGDDSWSVDFRYQSPSSTFNVYLDRFELSRRALSAVIAPGQNVFLSNFRLGNFCPTGGGESSVASGSNTIIARLRFKSRIAEEDTLLIKGVGCGSSSIMWLPGYLTPSASSLGWDILGRKIVNPPHLAPWIFRQPIE
jgi:hypothetical protein